MESTKYIGMDVHKERISIAVMNSAGKLVMESILETKALTLLQFVQGLRGNLQVTFEEGTWAAWLYDLLKPYVTKVPMKRSTSLQVSVLPAVAATETKGFQVWSKGCQKPSPLRPPNWLRDKAVKEMKLPSEFICLDLLVGSPVRSIDYWTGFSKSDVNGDATVATPEKGRVIFEAGC
jgi:hypothetical protein